MKRLIVRLTVCFSALTACCASAQEAAPNAAATPPGNETSTLIQQSDGQKLMVYAARNLPVGQLLEVVQALDHQLHVVAETVHNRLVMHGPTESVDVASQLLDKLDRRPAMVRVDMWVVGVIPERADELNPLIAERSSNELPQTLRQYEVEGWLKILDRFSVSTLEEQPAVVQMGQDIPVMTGATMTRLGQASNFQHQQFGMVASFTPRNAGGALVLDLKYEKSELQIRESDDEQRRLAGNDIPPGTRTRQATTTVRLPSGSAAVVGGGSLATEDGGAEWRIVLGVEILE